MAAMPQPLSQRLRHIAKAMRDTVPAIYEKKRLEMIDTSDVITVVSPPAMQSIVQYAIALGFPQITEKLAVAPHPVPNMMTCGGGSKQNKVLCVGRWEAADAAQKDPVKLLSVLKPFLSANPSWSAEIVGRGGEELRGSCLGWKPGILDRMVFTAAVSREELLEKYRASKIHLCPSRFESFHIASAEAVCCGASVVVGNHPLLASTSWFTTRESGTLAADLGVPALTAALTDEAAAWEKGKRDPAIISTTWQTALHAHHVASNITAAKWRA
jgi:glycosyltransferase involved in cell wall biosynthesis